MINVLLVDDDEMIRSILPSALKRHGISMEVAEDCADAKSRLGDTGTRPFDVILLDITMPGQTGIEYLEELRASGDQTPVIMVTSMSAHTARMEGFQLGADDYVVKPFQPDELAERVKAVIRRSQTLPIMHVKGLHIDVAHRSVQRSDKKVDLSPREFELLMALVEAKGDTLSRQQLLEQIWDVHHEPGTAVVEVQVARLRKKVDSKDNPVIQTVPGEGYRIDWS